CAAALIAAQVGGKATRDALFLGSFDVAALPAMLMASALFSLAIMPLGARAMTALGPSRIVPAAFVASAALLARACGLAPRLPGVVAVAVSPHASSMGAVLISWFWSLVNERFDPHTAKRVVAKIGAGASAGGLLGGLLAERLAHHVGVAGMLPVLAGLNLL